MLVTLSLIGFITLTLTLYISSQITAKAFIYQPIRNDNEIAPPSFLITKSYFDVWWSGPFMSAVRGVLMVIGLWTVLSWLVAAIY